MLIDYIEKNDIPRFIFNDIIEDIFYKLVLEKEDILNKIKSKKDSTNKIELIKLGDIN